MRIEIPSPRRILPFLALALALWTAIYEITHFESACLVRQEHKFSEQKPEFDEHAKRAQPRITAAFLRPVLACEVVQTLAEAYSWLERAIFSIQAPNVR